MSDELKIGEAILKKLKERKEQINDEWVKKEGNELARLQGERLAIDFILDLPEQLKAELENPVSENQEDD